jgi:hypothetical protein
VKDLFVRPDFGRSRAVVTFTAPVGCHGADWCVFDGDDDDDDVASGRVSCKPGALCRFEVDLPGFRPWNVNTPNLYNLEMILETADGDLKIEQPFGMRSLRVTEDGLYVNNERFYVKGYIRGREAHDHPNLEGLPLDAYYAKNFRMAKEYGFNFVRFHSQVPPPECFQAADRLGIFIHVEMRKYYGRYQKERSTMMQEGRLLDADEWAEMVLKLRNHPSLMVYCMGNEIDNPGSNPFCRELYDLTHSLDPTRFFLDTCSRGEFDREAVDLDVQHLSYFFPFGHSYDMFENTQNLLHIGSCKGLSVVEKNDEDASVYRIARRIPSPRPVLAHEVCHYVSWRDLEGLAAKFERVEADAPWWLEELRKLVRLKGHEADYDLLRRASVRFQFLCWKVTLEAARRSPLLSGFHMLQLSDTDRYENANGILDCFDDPKGVDREAFLQFNGDTVLLADLPRRTFFEKETVNIPVFLSHFSAELSGIADFSFELTGDGDEPVSISGTMATFDLDVRGLREICQLRVCLPAVSEPQALTLRVQLTGREGNWSVENSWDLWLYPDRPQALAPVTAVVDLDEVDISSRYPQIRETSGAGDVELMIAHRFTDEVFEQLGNGGDVLMLYRVPATRDRKWPAPGETYYLPATWDRFKGVIWDRGHNCGALVRESDALAGFPNDGCVNLQFHALIDGCDKIVLDDFPASVKPIMEGIDKASRDRFDVYTYKLSELQPDRTMRRFAYLFEVRVGTGRLLVSGFNFTGVGRNVPECCAMFESLVRYVRGDSFSPAVGMTVHELRDYLREKGQGPIVKERRMTQYWQLDEEPLESKRYWRESMEYLDDPPVVPDAWMKAQQEAKLRRDAE